MANIVKEFTGIEKEFFDLDENNKLAHMKLEFAKPSDIFDRNAITKIPVLSDDFLEWVISSFQYAPRGYKIALDIAFDDLEGYQEQELKDIFVKNMMLESKKSFRDSALKGKIAIGLATVGLIGLVSMILLMSLWSDGGIVKEIFSYIFDIAVTVTLWEALTILLVENLEKRKLRDDFIKRYQSIMFHQK